MPATINRFTVDRQTDMGRFFEPGHELSAAVNFNMTSYPPFMLLMCPLRVTRSNNHNSRSTRTPCRRLLSLDICSRHHRRHSHSCRCPNVTRTPHCPVATN